MFTSFGPPFWVITDITEPGVDFKLELLGGFACSEYVLDEKGMWPDDLCCEDTKTVNEQEEMAELEAIDQTARTEEEKDALKALRDILPECTPMCEKISNDETTIKEDIKVCKYYQAPGSAASTVGGCTFLAMAAGLFSAMYSLKAATKPSPSDLFLTKAFGAFGFLGFILGLLAVALFTPGTRGDTAGLKAGFFVQVIGLCALLGGVICIVDAGEKDLVMPALNFQSFATDDGKKSNKISPAAGV
jgi:hypothetical protein